MYKRQVFCIDGNNVVEIRQALDSAKKVCGKPTLIIGHCVMGKGALKADGTSYERNCGTHGAPLGGDAYRNTIKNLGGDPDNAFIIWDEVQDIFNSRHEELKTICAERHAEEKAWAAANPEKAQLQDNWFAGRLPEIPWDSIQQKQGEPTRNASSACLRLLAKNVPNMIVSSADLCNSDKTDGFIKGGATVITLSLIHISEPTRRS